MRPPNIDRIDLLANCAGISRSRSPTTPAALLFLSGILPVANGKLAISGRLGDNLSVEQGKEAAVIASLNALAVAKEHLGCRCL
jgi:hypothetical protein